MGAKPIYKKLLSSETLAKAIDFTQADSVIQKSKTLGAKIAKENGAKKSADIIIRLVENEKNRSNFR